MESNTNNNSNRFILIFAIKAIVAYLVWFFLYENWLLKVGWLDNIIIGHLISASEVLLNIFGYDYFIYGHSIGIDGSHGVYIGIPCNGLELMALFTSFVLIFHGPWKKKLWYIPLGIVAIHLLNVLRVFALILIENYNSEWMEFNHKYTFTIFLYMVVFLGWILWVKKFAPARNSN